MRQLSWWGFLGRIGRYFEQGGFWNIEGPQQWLMVAENMSMGLRRYKAIGEYLVESGRIRVGEGL